MDDCIFCKIVKKQIPASVVYEDEIVLAFNDIAPQAPHHILIIPKIHISSLEEINETNEDLAGKIITRAVSIAKELKLDGYRLVINTNESAGQTVFHLHCHLLGGRNMKWPPG